MGDGAMMQHPLDGCLFLAFNTLIQQHIDDEGDPLRLLAILGCTWMTSWAAAMSETLPPRS